MNKNKSLVSSAKDVFSYLLMIGMLYVGVAFFITLLWQYINVQFPDFINFYYTGSLEMIRVAISALLIGWPVFIFMQWLIAKDLKSDKHKAQVWIRKWMLHLTIFIAAITIIIDLITLVNYFLGGELALRIGLKTLVVLVVAALVFGYMLWELKRDVTEKTKIPMVCAIVSSTLILGWIIAGFFLVGSPSTQRDIRLDEERVENLQSIQYEILDQWSMSGELPESLESVHEPLFGFEAPVDPETGESYTYTKTSDRSFELCATFARESDPEREMRGSYDPYISYYKDESGMDFWHHSEGYQCFEREIDKDLEPDDVIRSEIINW